MYTGLYNILSMYVSFKIQLQFTITMTTTMAA